MSLLLILLKYLTVCACPHYCHSFNLSLYQCQCFKPMLYVGINPYGGLFKLFTPYGGQSKKFAKNSCFVKSEELNSTVQKFCLRGFI